MNFSVVKLVTTIDESGNETSENVTTDYVGSFSDGSFTASIGDLIVASQPWKPLQDGGRGEWTDIAEAVEWFQTQNNHITGE
tara:strand:+ start:312 stop:557 length:246 start_codon:yes stop_codon:yes gene_type:complete